MKKLKERVEENIKIETERKAKKERKAKEEEEEEHLLKISCLVGYSIQMNT
jgi:hypothetical protein